MSTLLLSNLLLISLIAAIVLNLYLLTKALKRVGLIQNSTKWTEQETEKYSPAYRVDRTKPHDTGQHQENKSIDNVDRDELEWAMENGSHSLNEALTLISEHKRSVAK